ncbi:DUF7507 domain-containing protein [Aquiflexum balticum]|nr:DUF11 domain-containing protein [Aquiflexum balticum]
MKKTFTCFANLALLLVLNFLAIPNEANAQNQPNLLDLRTCGNSCSSNNFTIKEVYLSDANGVPLSSSFATCTPGVQQTSFISFVYRSNSGSNSSNTRLFADLTVGGIPEFFNIWIGDLPAAKNADRVVTLNHSFTWTCGAEVRLDNPLLAWTTSGSGDFSSSYECNSYPSAQCQFGADIVVDAPLAVQFDFTACTVEGTTTVNFISTTNGGSQPYQYNWNFGNNASPTTSNLPNPIVTYTSAGSATLIVTDTKGVSNTFVKAVTIPNELIVNSTTAQPTPGNNDGSILLNTTGGTGNISVSWNDGTTGLERTGLAAGTYIATVTDAFNCQKSVTINLTSPEPNISLVKSGVYEDTNGDGLQNAGDRINYTFLVTNTGNFPLSNVLVSDPLIILTGNTFPLPVGESNNVAFSGTYTLTQLDIENGFFTNSASVIADAGNVKVNATDSHTENFTQLPSLIVEKNQIGGPNPVTAAGQELTYQITVENTGNVNISNVVTTDFLPGSSSGIVLNVVNGDNQNPGILDVGEIWVYSIDYNVEQNVFDTGDNLVNVVNVNSTQVPGPTVASAITPTVLSPALSIAKSVTETTFAAPGDELNYTITVSNTGNTTLENISVADPLTGLNTNIAVLAPGASQDINTVYAVDQDDIDAGSVSNTATASVNDISVNDEVTVTATQSPALSIAKAVTETTFAAPGDELNYTITVSNTGNTTLENISVADPLTGLNTTITVLAPGASQDINTVYAVDQDDIDAGSVSNTATASVGDISVNDEVTVTATQSPALSIAKAVTETTFAAPGDELNYTITVSNTGNTTLENISVADPLTGLNTSITVLAPGASQDINTTYTVDQDDIDAGSVSNMATASVGDISVNDEVTVTATQSPALSIAKAVTETTFAAPGDELNYTITVSNTGNTTLENISVVDPLTGLNTNITVLAPGASQDINTVYAVDQDDIDAGSVSNMATASVGDISVNDEVTVTATQSPALAISKSVAESSFAAPGDELNYTITVSNTGNTTLENIAVADPLTGLNTSITVLAPGASQDINTSYAVDQDDIDAGSVSNTATASVNDISVSDEVTVTATQSPALSISKAVTETTFAAPGDELNYTITVSNTGNTTLENISVADPLTGLNTTIAVLAPGASQDINTVYAVDQDDIDAGSVSNTATASVADISVNDEVTVSATQSPALSISKAVTETTFAAPGDELNYTITVSNTGNTTLENISVVDPLTGLNTNITVLAPGASQDINTVYAVDQDDIDSGSVSNTATASVGDISVNDEVTVNATQSPALAIAKAVTETTFAAPGDELNYTITVSNTGNTTLENISVADPLTGLNTTITVLAPGASQDINTTYAVDQDDIDAGSVSNTATASVDDISVSDEVTVSATQSPALSIAKSVTETTFAAPGDELNYTITVSNTGNTTLENISVADPLTGLNTTITVLAPGASQDINTTYAVDQDDIDAGSVSNTATASVGDLSVNDEVTVTATQSPALSIAKAVTETTFAAPGDELNYTITVSNTGNTTLENISVVDPLTGLNTTITVLAPGASQDINTVYAVDQDDIDAGSVSNTATASVNDISVNDEVTVTATQSPALSIAKAVTETTFAAPGDELNYTITVSNTGNTTLENISVVDPLTGLNTTITVLAPAASQDINTVYAVDQDDIDAGSVSNTATAAVNDLSVSDEVTVTGTQSPALAISKSVAESSFAAPGDELNYTITVSNTGNTTLENISVVDPLTGLNTSITVLAPSASQDINTVYAVDQDDIDAGSVSNIATASVGDISVNDEVTVNATQSPALSISKAVTESTFAAPGDELNYTITVSNTGNTTLENISVADPLTGLNTTITVLAPGASQDINTVYTVDQDDIDAGSVSNTATASVNDISVSDEVTVTATQSPALSISKAVTETTFAAPGDELNYTITVSNTGNTTLENISVVDPLTGLNTTITVLAPGASQDINTTYTVDQDDIDAGSVSNTATASVNDISVNDEVTVNATQSPALSISKAVTETTFAAPGDELNYTITVSNTGNTTLENISVVDPLTGLNTTITVLAPGASQDINTTYTVDQDDIDAGSVSNTATASVNDISVNDEVTVTATQSPALSIAKAVTETTFAAPGDELNYTITVSNTGNTTLENISVVDPLTGLNTTITVLAPGASQDINTTYAVDQDDIDAGSVSNTATASVNDISVNDEVTVTATQSPALAISKAVTETTFAAPGDELNYTITVSNTGNTTLENISVVDPLTGLNTTITVLAPGASQDINTTYTVDQDDIDAGSVSNTATASVNDISVNDEVTVNATQSPALAISKAVTETTFAAPGDELNYTITVSNTGNTTLENISVVDPLTGLNTTITVLAPGASQDINTTYTVDQDDIDAGSVSNTATASVNDISVNDEVTVNATQSPALSIAKAVTETTFAAPGDELNYTITVSNTGNTTLENISVVDPLTGLNTTISVQAPGASQDINTS